LFSHARTAGGVHSFVHEFGVSRLMDAIPPPFTARAIPAVLAKGTSNARVLGSGFVSMAVLTASSELKLPCVHHVRRHLIYVLSDPDESRRCGDDRMQSP